MTVLKQGPDQECLNDENFPVVNESMMKWTQFTTLIVATDHCTTSGNIAFYSMAPDISLHIAQLVLSLKVIASAVV